MGKEDRRPSSRHMEDIFPTGAEQQHRAVRRQEDNFQGQGGSCVPAWAQGAANMANQWDQS
eukprot:13792020-Heterocapsa_arctica.AAC.1